MDYQKSQIYTIRSHKTNEIYVGSTCSPLEKRIYQHRLDYKKWTKGNPNYMSSYEIIKHDDHYIELLEKFPCNSKNELRRKEGECIRQTENCVNKNIAGRTKKEWTTEHVDEIKLQKAEYYKKNADEFKLNNAEYYKQNADEIKLQHAEYLKKNADEIKLKKAEYFQKNADKLKIQHLEYVKQNAEKIKAYKAKWYQDNKKKPL